MATSSIRFNGINRAASDYSADGACEELINLRPTTGGLVPVREWQKSASDIAYRKVFSHVTSGTTNHIALKYASGDLIADLIDLENGGSFISNLFTEEIEVSSFNFDSVHFAYVGNLLLFSICDTANGIYLNKAFLWNGSAYEVQSADTPDLDISFEFGTLQLRGYNGALYTTSDSYDEIADILNIGMNAIQEQNKALCFGPVVIAIAYKTTDGKTFWTGQWFILDPRKVVDAGSATISGQPYVQDVGEELGSNYTSLFSRCDTAYIIGRADGPHLVQTKSTTYLAGASLKMSIEQLSGWTGDGSVLKSIEIYASRPQLYVDGEVVRGETQSYVVGTSPTVDYYFTLYPRKKDDILNLGGQLLYLQKSITLEDLAQDDQEVNFTFGGNIQTTEKTLEIDAGMVTRAGNLLAYNNRFHFFNSMATLKLGMPDFGLIDGESYHTCHVVVTYKGEEGDVVRKVGTTDVPVSLTSVISPSLNVTMVEVFYKSGSDYKYRPFLMEPSTTYNYSLCTNMEVGWQTITPLMSMYTKLYGYETMTAIPWVNTAEPSAINVTEQYNPFVFRVEHSYLAPGKVLDVQPQLVAVTDVTYGDYPLNVFTNRGTYALLQGSGNILYGAFKSVSNLVSQGSAISTDQGTFMLADGGLWVVAGDHAILVSDALSRGPHNFIRSSGGYTSLKTHYVTIMGKASLVPFETFTNGAVLSYNRYRDEIIISNPGFGYSYVLSLKYRQWFKIGRIIAQDVIGADIAESYSSSKAEITVLDTATIQVGDTITITLYDDVVVVAEFSHDVTSEEGQESGKPLLISHLVSEWNALPAAVGVTATAGTNNSIVFTRNSWDGTMGDSFSVELYLAGEYTEGESDYFSGCRDIIDFTNEYPESSSAYIHLQSRPFSMSYQYSHMHRIVAMIRSSLNLGKDLCVSLFGSDDLQNWALLSYAQQYGALAAKKISQLRTPPASRSWRYYTICVTGYVQNDTDLGPVLLDFEPVIRRIG